MKSPETKLFNSNCIVLAVSVLIISFYVFPFVYISANETASLFSVMFGTATIGEFPTFTDFLTDLFSIGSFQYIGTLFSLSFYVILVVNFVTAIMSLISICKWNSERFNFVNRYWLILNSVISMLAFLGFVGYIVYNAKGYGIDNILTYGSSSLISLTIFSMVSFVVSIIACRRYAHISTNTAKIR